MERRPILTQSNTPEDLQQALAVARSAAGEAGEILLRTRGHLSEAQISSKSAARDLVTEVDIECERAIVKRLRAAFPTHAIEAEEEVRDRGDAAAGPRWYVDPLDGTVNFVHGIPCFCVSIALYIDGVGELGVVHAPALGESFHALRGRGAFLNDRPIRVSQTSTLGESVLATGFPYRRGELANDNLENFGAVFHKVRGLRRLGSAALDLAFTAAGRMDAFWELHLAPHDVAAGAVLVCEAGGTVCDLDGGDDWLYGGQIAAGGAALVETLRAHVTAK